MALNLAFCQHLTNKDTQVIAYFQLVRYDHDMRLLYHDLQKLLLEWFGPAPPEFQPHQRLVFLHDDLDFWISHDSVPFTLYNLQLILRELGISNCFCRVVTNLPNYQIYANRVAEILTDDAPIKVIDSSLLQNCYLEDPNNFRPDRVYSPEIDDLDACAHEIKWPFWLATRVNRPHRTLFMSELHHRGLHQYGLITYHNIDSSPLHKTSRQEESAESVSLPLLTVNHWTRHNNDLHLTDPDMMDRYRAFQNIDHLYNPVDREPPSWWDATRWINRDIHQALLSICLETTASLPRPFVSRITMRPLLHWRPFVILGCPGTLRFLHDLGFKTFNAFWNENYDNLPGVDDRVRAIAGIVQEISAMSLGQLSDLYINMLPVIEHNRNHYLGTFGSNTLSAFRQGLD